MRRFLISAFFLVFLFVVHAFRLLFCDKSDHPGGFSNANLKSKEKKTPQLLLHVYRDIFKNVTLLVILLAD